MQQRMLGATGIRVSALGLGTGGLGASDLSEAQVEKVLRGAVERGVTLFDSARSYGLAEQRLGRQLAPLRKELVLCTKGGYGVDGVPDWTGEAVTLGIHRALRQLRTDCIDLFLLHSCPLEVLQREELAEALGAARAAGKIRVAGYSGENDALAWAIRSGLFGVVECSVNLVDQRSLGGLIDEASARGLGVLAKRPICSGAFMHAQVPSQGDVAIYWGRLQKLGLDGSTMPLHELALRFAVHARGVASAVVGCRSLEHLEANIGALNAGPLPPERLAELARAYQRVGAGWDGLI